MNAYTGIWALTIIFILAVTGGLLLFIYWALKEGEWIYKIMAVVLLLIPLLLWIKVS